jgi:transcriptional regulator with XRE-family HTH domain
MEFGEQIKEVRVRQSLTQEQFAQRLHVTRQAVSNWENNRNLPDLEMLIQISTQFCVSLDQLLLGGTDMNKLTEKLIQDGSETRRAKMNLASTAIGAALLLISFVCLVIKTLSVEYVDEAGLLHENFFLLPIGFLFLLCGTITVLAAGIRLAVRRRRESRHQG